MSPEQLSLQLTEAREAFVPIMGKPSHNDIVSIQEALAPLILQAGYDKNHTNHNLWDITTPEAA